MRLWSKTVSVGQNDRDEEGMERERPLIGYSDCEKTAKTVGFTEHPRWLSLRSGFSRLCLVPIISWTINTATY